MSILTKYEKQFDIPPNKKDWLSLDRIEKLLEELGNPQNKLKGVHVAGTNGKGSTCAMLQSILTQSGYKVGMFTSPHISSLCERFRIGYKDISEKKLVKYFERIKPYAEQVKKEINDSPTWFEILTCIAILYFVDEGVDVAIFEVGLGGRLDATNVLDLGICAITDISIDHQDYLGNTISKIAKEKAGIIKSNSVVITSNRGIALKVIKKACKQNSAKLLITSEINSRYELKLLGKHQRRNAGIVLAVAKELIKKYKILEHDIKQGLIKTKWPARFELFVTSHQLPVIIDGAHNPAGIKSLVQTFKQQGYKKAIVLFSAKQSKDVRSNLKTLRPIIEQVIFPELPLDFIYKSSTLKRYFGKGLILNNADSAIKKARILARENDLPILICGSIYAISYYKDLI